jgi:elongation factor 1-gamma
VYPVLGYIAPNAGLTAKAKQDVANALTILENHLVDKTYLVGHRITLADITVVSSLVYVFKFVADGAFRGQFPNVGRWFDTCVHQTNFISVIGNVALCQKEMTAGEAVGAAAAKKADKPKAEKPKAEKAAPKPKEEKPKPAPKPKDDDDEEDEKPKEKKEDHVFKLLDQSNPSPFVMDNWKRTYSNCKGDYVGAMKSFWETFDAEGWSLWRGDYKYNDENTVLFMTSNLIGGFIQRTEEIRKWFFGTMTIRGEAGVAGGMKVTGVFLIRGQDITPLIKCNDDAECYNWTKINVPVSDADKAMVFEFWTADDKLEGEPCLDSRCYK